MESSATSTRPRTPGRRASTTASRRSRSSLLQLLVLRSAVAPAAVLPPGEGSVGAHGDGLQRGLPREAILEGGVLGRGEGEVDEREGSRRVAPEALEAPVLVGALVEPLVRPGEAELLGRAAQAHVEREVRGGRSDAGQGREAGPPLLRHERAHRGRPAGVAHHHRRAHHAPAGEPDPGRTAVLHDHLLDVGRHRDVAAGRLDDRQDGRGDAARPAHRVGGAVQVVLGHEGVVAEAGERGGKPVVAVLPGQDGAEDRVLHVGGDDLARGPAGVAEEAAPHESAQQRGHAWRQGAGPEVRAGGAGAGLHLGQVGRDALPLRGEGRGEPLDEAIRSRREVELPIAHHDAVVDVGHRRPVQFTVRDVVEEAAQRASASGHLADVVHAHVPLEAVALEGVGEPAGGVVALEHEHPHPPPSRQHRRGAQAADSRADDHRVEGSLDRALLPGRADALRQGSTSGTAAY